LQSRREDSIKLGIGQQDQIQRKQIKGTSHIKEEKEKRRANKHILNTRRLELVEKLKYLGIYLDRRFTFDKHIKYTANKCTGLINMLSRPSKLKWGLGHHALKTIYKGAIIPVWEEAIQKQRNV
jgi:hypothetical protein